MTDTVAATCPECAALLRLRGRPEEPLSAPCPDCGTPLTFFAEGDGGVRANRAATPRLVQPSPTVVPSALAARLRSGATAAARLVRGWASEPLAVIWTAAAVAAVTLAAAFLRVEPDTVRPRRLAAEEAAPKVPATLPSDITADEEVVASTATAPSAAVLPAVPVAPPLPVMQRVMRPPLVAPKPPAVDPRDAIAAALAVRLVRFEQPTPVSFERLRLQFEELTGVPIRHADGQSPPSGERLVTLDLRDVSLGEALAAACRSAGLRFVITPTGVTLRPFGVSDTIGTAETSPREGGPHGPR